MNFIMTTDVECYSFETNSFDYENVHKKILTVALPRLLELYKHFDVRSTFFFTGKFAELCPESVRLVVSHGHEVGAHGYRHEDEYMFDKLSFDSQVYYLQKSKDILESIINEEVISFRAPALRINQLTIKALEKTGFTIDSSVASQRFDGPFTSGASRKMGWLMAPRNPYYADYDSPFKSGESEVLEVPISSLLFGFTGTTMRILPAIHDMLYRILALEKKKPQRTLVFLFHPNEILDINRSKITTKRRSHNFFSYLFSDILRHRMKRRNLGNNAFILLRKLLNKTKNEGAHFLTLKEYKKIYWDR